MTAGSSCVLLFACAQVLPDVTVDASVPSPLVAPEGQALLVFYRPKDFRERVNVMDTSGRFVTTVAHGTFVAIAVPPGQRDFVVFVSPNNGRPLRTTLAAGQIAPIEIGIDVGFWSMNIRVNAHGSLAALEGLQATMPADLRRAENVLHDTWNVPAVLERAKARYAGLSDEERAACTLAP
jgi:hypothetical protein